MFIKYLRLTQDFLSSFNGLWSLLQLCPLQNIFLEASRLQVAPPFCYYCLWCSFHGTGNPKLLGSLVANGLHFHQQLLVGSLQGLQHCHTVLIVSCSPWSINAFKTSTIWVTLVLPSLAASTGYTLAASETQLFHADFEEILPRLHHLNAIGLFLTIAVSSAPDD